MNSTPEDVIDEQTTVAETGTPPVDSAAPRVVPASSLAGASPAVPRDPRLLRAEEADYEARTAAEAAEAAKQAAEDAAARAAASKAAAEKTKAELDAARAEAKAKAEAAALQVKLEQEELDQALAAARSQGRAARDEKLGTVRPVATAEPEVITVTKRNTDGFAGSLALFLVRLALAAWSGIVGFQSIYDLQATVDALVKVGIPEASSGPLAWAVSIGLIVIAFFLLFGLGTRIFATVLLAGVIGFLAYFRFGPFSPFLEGHFGFYGDRDVLLAVSCLVLLLLGAGGFSLDARIRRRRAAAKLAD